MRKIYTKNYPFNFLLRNNYTTTSLYKGKALCIPRHGLKRTDSSKGSR